MPGRRLGKFRFSLDQPPQTYTPFSTLVRGTPGLLIYLPFGEATGTVANDAISLDDGAYQAGTTIAQTGLSSVEPTRTSVLLNGTSGSILVPAAHVPNTGDNFTWMMGVKRTATGASAQRLYDRLASGDFQIFISSANGGTTDHWDIEWQGGGAAMCVSTSSLDTNAHLLIATKNGASIHLYQDGVDVSGSITNQTVTGATGQITVGAHRSGGSDFYNGTAQDFALYNRAISAAEVTALWNAWGSAAPNQYTKTLTASLSLNSTPNNYQTAMLSFSPLGYWRQDATSGTSDTDLGSGGHNITLQNTPTLNQVSLLPSGEDASISYNGSNEFSEVVGTNYAVADVFTIVAWFSTTNLTTQEFIFEESGTGTTPFLDVNDASGGTVSVGVAGVSFITTSTVSITSGAPYMVVWSKNGATNHLYLNNVDVTGAVTNSTMTNPGAGNTYWGIQRDGTGFPFTGSLDELAILGTALAATDVNTLWLAAQNSGLFQKKTNKLTAGVLNLGAGYASTILDETGLAAYFRMDQTSGHLIDIVGGHNTTSETALTYSATGLLTGDPDKAVSFDGSTSTATTPQASFPQVGTSDFSVEVWTNRVSASGNSKIIVSAINSSGSNGWQVAESVSGVPEFFLSDGTNNFDAFDGSFTIANGTTHHIVGTRSGATGKLYVDGQLIKSVTAGANPNPAAQDFTISHNPGSAGDFFNGTIDEVAFYTVALSATQVSNHYAAGQGGLGLIKKTSHLLSGVLSFAGAIVKRTARAVAGVLTFTGSFTKSRLATLTGSLSFTGSFIKRTGKNLTGGLSFSGAITRAVSYPLTATLSFVGAIVRAINRPSLAGVLSFTGTLTKARLALLTAALSFTGAIQKRTSHLQTATLTFTGSQTKVITHSLTAAALSFSGSFTKQTNKLLSGALSFTGSFSHALVKQLTAALSFTGSITKRTSHLQTAALSFTGAMTKRTSRALSAALSFSGAIQKQANKTLSGVLSFTGSFLRGRVLAGALSFTGNIQKRTSHLMAGGLSFSTLFLFADQLHMTAALSFAGSMTRQTGKSLAGVLSFTGQTLKRTARSLTGVLSFTGAIQKQTGKALSGVLSFSGAIQRAIIHTLTGTLSFTGAIQKRVSHLLSGVLSFTGSVAKSSSRALSATLSFTGSIQKQTNKLLNAVLSFVGNFSTFSGNNVFFTAALTFTGAVTNRTSHLMAGTLSFTGAIQKQANKLLAGVLSFSGTFSKRTQKTLAGVLSFTGAIKRSVAHLQTATLSFSGAMTKRTSHLMAGVLSFSGSTAKQTNRLLSGALSFAGNIRKQTSKLLSGVLSFVGNFSTFSGNHVFFTAALNFSGAVTNRTSHLMAATQSFTGALTKRTSRALTGVLSFSGTLNKVRPLLLTAALSFSGAMRKQTGKTLSGVLTFSGSITRALPMTMTAALTFGGSLVKRTSRAFTGSLSFAGSVGALIVSLVIPAFNATSTALTSAASSLAATAASISNAATSAMTALVAAISSLSAGPTFTASSGARGTMSLNFVQGDTSPDITSTIHLESDGVTPINLTGATVRFQMRKPDDARYTVNAAATIVSPTAGTVSYTWQTNDLSNPGTYQIQWEVTFAGGKIQTTAETESLVVRPQ